MAQGNEIFSEHELFKRTCFRVHVLIILYFSDTMDCQGFRQKVVVTTKAENCSPITL